MSAPRHVLIAALLFTLVTPWVLRPWFLTADGLPRVETSVAALNDADLGLNVWILAWVARALVHAPSELFDGNIYHPAPHAIIGSENMLAHVPFTVPVLALTGNALLVLKAMVLESFVLSALAMWLLVFHHTKSMPAALVAGACYAFTPLRVGTIPQPQYLGTQYLPLALLGVDCWLESERPRALVGLAVTLAMQALACVYVGFFAFVAVPVYALARLAILPPPWRRRSAGMLAAIAAGGLAVVPAALPYLQGRQLGIIPAQSIVLVTAFSWPPWIYLTPAIFDKVGLVAPLVVAADVVGRLLARFAGRRVRASSPENATWCIAACGVLFSAGPFLRLGALTVPLPYLLLYNYLPGFSTIRVPARFFIVVALALSALTGYAVARLASRWPRATWLGAIALFGIAAVHAAPTAVPVTSAHLGARAPAVYRWLAAQAPGGSIVELPGAIADDDLLGNQRNGRYMMASTIHWRPLVNGYTAYPPATNPLMVALMRRLPEPGAFDALVDTVDVRWILIHHAELSAPEDAAWRAARLPGLESVARFGDDEVLRVTRAPTHGWRGEIGARARSVQDTTLAGIPLVPLPPECRTGVLLGVEMPRELWSAALAQAVRVRFENTSECAWPGYEVLPDHLVGLSYRCVSPTGKRTTGPFTRLVRDVPPHTIVDDTMIVAAPGIEPGTWHCEVVLVQQGSETPIARQSVTVEVHGWAG